MCDDVKGKRGTTPMPDMRRRDFITLVGGAALWPLAARAQSKPARIALLGSGAAQSSRILVDALKQGLADNGLIEEQGYVLDIRWAEGEYNRFPALAADVVSRNPNVILATTIAAVRSARERDHSDRHEHHQRSGGSWTHRQPGEARREHHGYRQLERGFDSQGTGNPFPLIVKISDVALTELESWSPPHLPVMARTRWPTWCSKPLGATRMAVTYDVHFRSPRADL